MNPGDGPERTVRLTSLDHVTAWAERAASTVERDPGRAAVYAGLREGLASTDPTVSLYWPDELPGRDASDEQRRRAGVLAGHLIRDRLRDGSSIPEPVMLADIAYASALATPQAQRLFAGISASNVLRAHIYACVLVERHGHRLPEPDERELFEWLLAQAAIPSDASLLDAMQRARTRRHARLTGGTS